jgi:metallo-beta-lactamase class B
MLDRRRAAIRTFYSLLGVLIAGLAAARGDPLCPTCNELNQPRPPQHIFGNTWYVGTQGLSAILITSDYGHVLIDGGLRESAQQIAASVVALGFKVTDIKAILNSHAHFDHAGGIGELQRLSGADVFALRPANDVLTSGRLSVDDPQHDKPARPIPSVARVWVLNDEQWLGVGSVRLRALATPGHTPGGTTWTWESCADNQCLAMVYADSLSPVAAERYRFGAHAEVLQAFERSFAVLESLRCDVLLTPHPDRSQLFERLERAKSDATLLKDEAGCKRYVEGARAALAARLQEESRMALPRKR